MSFLFAGLETKAKAKETYGFLEVTVDVGEARRLAAFLLLPRDRAGLALISTPVSLGTLPHWMQTSCK